MLTNLLFRWRAAANGSRIHRTAIIVNTKRIRIGAHCIIEPHATIRGGESDGAGLFIEDSVIVKTGAYISARRAQIVLKEHAFVGVNTWIGGQGRIEVGRNSMISIGCVVISSNHDYSKIQVPYYYGPEIAEDIRIGSNVWIGSQTVILPGVEIGDGSVVGAGSVVTKDIPPNSLALGNPALVIRSIERA